MFNLPNRYTYEARIGYFPYTDGVDRDGTECLMVVRHDPTASGCNPYYWDRSLNKQYGHEFPNSEEAEYNAKWARGSWSVKSVNNAEFKVGKVKFTVQKTFANIGYKEKI
jgi:hypothetical protein